MAPVLMLALLVGSLAWVLAYPWNSGELDFSRTEAVLLGGGAGPADRDRLPERIMRRLHLHPDPDSKLARNLALSGHATTLYDLYLYKALAVAGGLLLAGLVIAAGDLVIGIPLALMGLAGWGLPDARITGQARRYRQEVIRRLPAFLQALAIMTEAGMNLYPAIQAFLEQEDGVLGRELRRAMDEVELGAPLSEALMRMAARCQVDDLYRAVATLMQAAERGASGLTGTCRELAAEAWVRRKDAARELGQQAATKMFLPMMLLVLPTLFLFMMGPAAYNLLQNF